MIVRFKSIDVSKTKYEQQLRTICQLESWEPSKISMDRIIPKGKWQGWNLLAYLIRNEETEIVKFLSEKNRSELYSNPIMPNGIYKGWDIVEYAVYNNCHEIFKRLMDESGWPHYNLYTKIFTQGRFKGWKLFSYAIYQNYTNIVKIITGTFLNPTPVFYERDFEFPNGSYQTWSLLSYASYQNNLEIVECLLKLGVKPSHEQIVWAQANLSIEIVQLLRIYGVKTSNYKHQKKVDTSKHIADSTNIKKNSTPLSPDKKIVSLKNLMSQKNKITEKKELVEKLWKLSDVAAYITKIKNAINQNNMSLVAEYFYEFGLYHINNSMQFTKEIAESPTNEDFKSLALDTKIYELTDNHHVMVHYAMHTAHHYYRGLDNCDIYMRQIFESFSAGVTLYIDLLYPVKSPQENKFLEVKQSIIQPKFEKEYQKNNQKNFFVEQEYNFMIKQSKSIIKILNRLTIKIQREQVEKMEFKAYINTDQLMNYIDENNIYKQEMKDLLLIYNYYLLNGTLTHDQLLQRFETNSIPEINSFISRRGKDDIMPISESLTLLKLHLIEIESQIIIKSFKDGYNAARKIVLETFTGDAVLPNESAWNENIFLCDIFGIIIVYSLSDIIKNYQLNHFRINNMDAGCVISQIDFLILCHLIGYIDILKNECCSRNVKYFKPHFDILDVKIRKLLNIIPNNHFHEDLGRLTQDIFNSFRKMYQYYCDHAGGEVLRIAINRIKSILHQHFKSDNPTHGYDKMTLFTPVRKATNDFKSADTVSHVGTLLPQIQYSTINLKLS